MKTSFKTRAVAFLVSVFVTFGAVKAIAEYAHPVAQPMQLASAAR
jgi:hypothetical protein